MFLLAFLLSIAAVPHDLPGYTVLAVRGERLAVLLTPTKPDPAPLRWEGAGSRPAVLEGCVNSALTVKLHLDYLGSFSPYFYDLVLSQSADGRVICWVGRTQAGIAVESETYYADSYAVLANVKTISGDTIAELLAKAADGYPPADIDALAARLVADRAEVGAEVRKAIGAADSDNWRVRERALAVLARSENIPQARQALATETLTPMQQQVVEAALEPLPVGAAVVGAAMWELRNR